MSDYNDPQRLIKTFIDKMDWKGLAETWQEADLDWHANEWKEFIHSVREEAIRKEREWWRNQILDHMKYEESAMTMGGKLLSLQTKEGEWK